MIKHFAINGELEVIVSKGMPLNFQLKEHCIANKIKPGFYIVQARSLKYSCGDPLISPVRPFLVQVWIRQGVLRVRFIDCPPYT